MRSTPCFISVLVLLAWGCSSETKSKETLAAPPNPPNSVGSASPPVRAKREGEVKAAKKIAQPAPSPRDPHHSLLGKWIDGEGTTYNFKSGGVVDWTHPVSATAANFEGKYTLTDGQLVIVPKQASSPERSLSKQLGGLKAKHRLTEYMLAWQPDGTLVLTGQSGTLSLRAIR